MGKKIDAYSGATIGCIEQFRLAEDCIDAAVEYIETPRPYQTEIDCENNPLRGLFDAAAVYANLIDSPCNDEVVVKASKRRAKLMTKTALWLLAGDINIVEATRFGFAQPADLLSIAIEDYTYLVDYYRDQRDLTKVRKYRSKGNRAQVVSEFAKEAEELTEDSSDRRQHLYHSIRGYIAGLKPEFISYEHKDELLAQWQRVGENKAFIALPRRSGGYSRKHGTIKER